MEKLFTEERLTAELKELLFDTPLDRLGCSITDFLEGNQVISRQ